MKRVILLTALAGALLAGCGEDEEEQASTTPAAPPTDTGATATQPQQPGSGAGGVKLVKVGDFEAPLHVTQPPNSSDLYVVEQGGRVRVVRDGQVQEKPFLDLSGEVTAGGEQGLLSLAFAPDYERSRLLYVYFTGTDQNQHVVEFKASEDGKSVDAGSARELLAMDDFAPNHNGGLLLFGPDERLYIGTGDGGIADDPERNGQDLGSLLGKLLRIDPRPSSTAATDTAEQRPYAVPTDNPFVNREGARPEVYSYGLRNPWRFSFDRETQALSIGDVGQNAQEEIDYVAAGRGAGANFGWSAFEGTDRFNEDQEAPNAIEPILTYSLSDGGCAITGGYVVRDPALTSLFGRYVYGDFCEGQLRSLVPSPNGARGDRELGLEVPALSSFGEDNAGRIYATSLEGPVYRLAPE
jgi:glucose/arabinose dehydrogenase